MCQLLDQLGAECMLHRVNSFYCINKKGWNRNTNLEHCSTSSRGVWRSWQRACLACMRSPVRFRQCPLLVQLVAAAHARWTLSALDTNDCILRPSERVIGSIIIVAVQLVAASHTICTVHCTHAFYGRPIALLVRL